MRGNAPTIVLLALAVMLAGAQRESVASTFPSNFAIDDAAPAAGFVDPTGMAFLPDGRFFVTEKRGRVFEVRNGVKRPTAIWAADNEVLNIGDTGLLSIAVDPQYYANHYIYLLYVVDPDSNGTDNNTAGFTRLARYTVNFTDSATVLASSRTILLGTSWTTGVLECSSSHSAGSLRWGRDGSLLLTVGDGAHYEYMDSGGHDGAAFGSGKTATYEDIGAFRAQDISVLPGKVLRLNPATGRGYASNPFANSNLASAQSRVWCYGLRNPFRFTVKPGTGSADTSAASPGTLLIGDVGYNTWEETNVAASGGLNFGWPCYEGVGSLSAYQSATPAHNGCGSIGTATNPSTVRAPLSSWNHSTGTNSIPSGLVGNCATGGTFYSGTQYPAAYRGQYLLGDYGKDWIKLATFDVNNNLVSVSDFIGTADGPVDFSVDPLSGDIFYVAINTGQVRRIRYTAAGSGNTPPVAAIAATPLSGSTPLTVSFSSSGSTDANGDPLTITWAFGDATGSTLANPTHVFTTPGVYNVQLTVSDGRGGTDVKYITINAGASVIAFPSTPVLDTFDRANGVVGGQWADQTATFSINTNMLAPASSVGYIEWNGATYGQDQEVYVTLGAFPGASLEQNLMLKTQGSTWSAGHIEVALNGGSSNVTVYTLQTGVGWTTIGTVAGAGFVAGDRFGARALADGSVQVFRNSTVIGTFSVAGWAYAAAGGRIGISYDTATGSRFDNFGGGNVTSNVNTKPVATIVAPLNNSFYYAGQTVAMTGTALDAQTPSDSLAFIWVVDLIHNNHVHPGNFNVTGANASFVGENHDDGTGVHLRVKLSVSDPQGAVSDTAKVDIWPEIDLNAAAVTVAPASPIAGQSAHYSITLNNTGRMPAPVSRWVLRAGSTVVAQGDTVVPGLSSLVIERDATLPTVGTFTLRLTADSLAAVYETSETNNTSTRALTVIAAPVNHAPVARAAGLPQSGLAPLAVSFSGATSTDSDNDSLTFAWAFGDGGAATGRLASHSYDAVGNYAALLTVTDGRGGSDTASVAVSATAPGNNAPLADATAAPQSGLIPLSVSFSGANSTDADGDSLSFAWAFGDGGTALGRLANHNYTAAGNYAAILTVSDGRGGNDTASVAITATAPPNTPPVANAVGLPKSGVAPLLVSFSGAASTDADNDSLSFAWAFGDGGTALGRLASHSYATAGNFATILTVSDGRGGSDTASVAIATTAPVGGFPQTAILDNFNRTNGAAPGANWIDQPTKFAIATNTLAPKTGDNYIEWNPTVFGANQEVFVKLSTVGTTAPEQNLMLKTQGTTWAAGHIEVSYNAPAAKVIVYTFTPPSTWATRGTLNVVTLTAGQQFGARALANGDVQVYRNGVLLGTVSVAGWAYSAGGGRIGLSCSNATTTRFDDFGGGNVAVALTLTTPPPGSAASLALAAALPEAIELTNPFPNPTRGGVAFTLTLPRATEVEMSILDIQGREIWATPRESRGAGRGSLVWSGQASRGIVPAGVYLARVRVGSELYLRRFAIVR